MTGDEEPDAEPAGSKLSPAEAASRDFLVGTIARGSMMAVRPVLRADSGNRILDAAASRLWDHGFLVAVVNGGAGNVVEATWRKTATLRSEAQRKNALRPMVLIVKDAHLLPSDNLTLLRQAGDLAIVMTPAGVAPSGKLATAQSIGFAALVAAPVLAASVFLMLAWPPVLPGDLSNGAERLELSLAGRAVVVPQIASAFEESEAEGAPGLLIKARAGDTLLALYQRVYLGVVPPPFQAVALLNPEPVRPGDILTFPQPAGGWAAPSVVGSEAETGPPRSR